MAPHLTAAKLFSTATTVAALVMLAAGCAANDTPIEWQLDCPGCPVVFLDGQEPEIVGGQMLEMDVDLRILGCTEEQTTLHKQFVFDAAEEYVAAVIFTPRIPPWEDKRTCFEMVGRYDGEQEFERKRFIGPGGLPVGSSIGSLKVYRVSDWAEIDGAKEIQRLDYQVLVPSPTPEPTISAEQEPTSIPMPTTASAVAQVQSTSTSSRDERRFAAQQTRAAPTRAVIPTLAPTIVAFEGRHGQWVMGAVSPTAQMMEQGLAGTRHISDRKGQQYTCAYYLDGTEVPRINLAFPKDLTYTVVTNQYGERQGAIDATTSVDGEAIPLEWRTWATRVDRIRLREDDAVRLVREIQERGTPEFELALHDDPELSRAYDVSILVEAMEANEMTCFIGR